MLSHTSANAIELLAASGSQPTAQWAVRGKIARSYDPVLRSYALLCEGGPTTRLALPKDERRSLALPHHVLVLQLALSRERPFSFELTLSDAAATRRRFAFSTSLREPASTALHTRLPLLDLPRGTWLNVVVDLSELLEAFFGTAFARLDGLELGSSCRVRRIFALRGLRAPGAAGAGGAGTAPEEAGASAEELAHLLSGDASFSAMPRAWAYAAAAEALTVPLDARAMASAGSPPGTGGTHHNGCGSSPPSASVTDGGGCATSPPWARDAHSQRVACGTSRGSRSPMHIGGGGGSSGAGGGVGVGGGVGGGGGGGGHEGAPWSGGLGSRFSKLRQQPLHAPAGSIGLPIVRANQMTAALGQAAGVAPAAPQPSACAPRSVAASPTGAAAAASLTPTREASAPRSGSHRQHGRAGLVSPIQIPVHMQAPWGASASATGGCGGGGGAACAGAAVGSPCVSLHDAMGAGRESMRYGVPAALGAQSPPAVPGGGGSGPGSPARSPCGGFGACLAAAAEGGGAAVGLSELGQRRRRLRELEPSLRASRGEEGGAAAAGPATPSAALPQPTTLARARSKSRARAVPPQRTPDGSLTDRPVASAGRRLRVGSGGAAGGSARRATHAGGFALGRAAGAGGADAGGGADVLFRSGLGRAPLGSVGLGGSLGLRLDLARYGGSGAPHSRGGCGAPASPLDNPAAAAAGHDAKLPSASPGLGSLCASRQLHAPLSPAHGAHALAPPRRASAFGSPERSSAAALDAELRRGREAALAGLGSAAHRHAHEPQPRLGFGSPAEPRRQSGAARGAARADARDGDNWAGERAREGAGLGDGDGEDDGDGGSADYVSARGSEPGARSDPGSADLGSEEGAAATDGADDSALGGPRWARRSTELAHGGGGSPARLGIGRALPRAPRDAQQLPAEDLGTPSDEEEPAGCGGGRAPRRAAPWAASAGAGSGAELGQSGSGHGGAADRGGWRDGAAGCGGEGADAAFHSGRAFWQPSAFSPRAQAEPFADASSPRSGRSGAAGVLSPHQAFSPRSQADAELSSDEGGRKPRRARLSAERDALGARGGGGFGSAARSRTSSSSAGARAGRAGWQGGGRTPPSGARGAARGWPGDADKPDESCGNAGAFGADAARAAFLSAAARDSERASGERRPSDGRRGSGGSGARAAGGHESSRRPLSSQRKASPVHSAADEEYGRALDADVLIGSRLQSPKLAEQATPGGAAGDGERRRRCSSHLRHLPPQRDIFSPLVIPPSSAAERRAEAIAASASGGQRALHSVAQVASLGRESEEDDVVDLLYDPTLNCYYEPRTGKYYELSI